MGSVLSVALGQGLYWYVGRVRADFCVELRRRERDWIASVDR